METIKAIESRRAIRHFDPSYRISEAEEQQLLSPALCIHPLLSISRTGVSCWSKIPFSVS